MSDDFAIHIQVAHVVDDDANVEIGIIGLNHQASEQGGLSRAQKPVQNQDRHPVSRFVHLMSSGQDSPFE
ncbi:MAG: hypothetical protein MK082_13180 [Phycisphaerales bacterium]|nr:hypothetical protein [Phycisphaerales bacterium]